MLLYNEDREEHVWNSGDSLGHLWVLISSVKMVNGLLQQPYFDQSKATKVSDSLSLKVLVTLLSKQPKPI